MQGTLTDQILVLRRLWVINSFRIINHYAAILAVEA